LTSGEQINMKTLLGLTAAAAALGLAAPAAAAPVPADKNAKATARIVKPLALYYVQDLSLGDVLLSGAGTWTGAVVEISPTGTFKCLNANVTCSGTTQPAKYRVTGTNNQTVTITAGNVTMTNANDSTKTLLLSVQNPGTVLLGNSGNTGVEFGLGGSIAVSSDTSDGVYSGTFNVTVDY